MSLKYEIGCVFAGRDWPEGPLMADLLSDGNALHFINDPIGSDNEIYYTI